VPNFQATIASTDRTTNPMQIEVSQDKQQLRFTAILTTIQQTGKVVVEELSEQLGVSLVTVRRDLDVLEQKGLLRRTSWRRGLHGTIVL